MTRLNAAVHIPPKPASVSLCELAIAAGAAGHSVTVRFSDWPARALCKLWQYCTNFTGPSEVCHIRSQSDIRKLPEACEAVKLVLIHAAKLGTAAAWAIEMTSSADTEANSRPAIFCAATPGLDADYPGAALQIWANSGEIAAVERWFTIGQFPNVPNWQGIDGDLSVIPAPALAYILTPGHGDELGLRDCEQELLRYLTEGAAALRSLGHGAEQPQAVEMLSLTLEDYEHVRLLLHSPSIAPVDETCDPLAREMVSRANVFLHARFTESNVSESPLNIGASASRDHGADRDLITRREIADLGNIRSRLVRQLVDFLVRQSDGYERFQRMGLVRRPPSRDQWRSMESAAILSYLRPWSAKQVRTHFDYLRRAHLITAERESRNGPWRYALPEELQGGRGSYRQLPAVAELIARQPVG